MAPEDRQYWQSLVELAAGPAEREHRVQPFAERAADASEEPSRRQFLKLMAASLALAGGEGCGRPPDETIVPYVQMPEQLVPGRALFVATAMPLGGYGIGLVVESHLGRPTKIEGNRLHPASGRATDLFSQASVLTLYDPDRAQAAKCRSRVVSRDYFRKQVGDQRDRLLDHRGAGLRILTGRVTSPTLADQIARLLSDFPAAAWHQYEPIVGDGSLEGAIRAFGHPLETYIFTNRFFGPYRFWYWLLILCNVVVPQVVWIKAVRIQPVVLFLISLLINVGMWLERFIIIVCSLHRDHLPSSWGMYYPTRWDWAFLFGSVGLFVSLLFLFLRLLPVISISEMRELTEEHP